MEHEPESRSEACDPEERTGHTSLAGTGDAPSGHHYPVIYVSGHAQAHFGDQYYNQHGQYASRQDHHVLPGTSKGDAQQLADEIYFPEMRQRVETVGDRHGSTYQWIFEPPLPYQRTWDSFVGWLQDDQPLYWVSGKPGSGKSMMIKFMMSTLQQRAERPRYDPADEEPATQQIVLSHFFWEAGGELQRSIEGCLRTLLWQLLRCPNLSREACQAVRTFAGCTWTHTRLRSALEAALRHARTPICLFLDGLDECRDGEDLVEFVEELAGMARLKICVSSRPEQLYVDTFSDKPKLRVQDLNRNDIYTVINEKFKSNPRVGRMGVVNPAALDQLATSIERKAQGVFLWVHLAIRSVLRGFRNRDTLEILQRRLEELPDDIYGLYRNMLQRNGKDNVLYAQQAALYCRLVLHQTSGLRLTDFCLAIDDGLRQQFLQFDQVWDGKITEAELDCASAITWLNVRTGGLLEVYADYPAPLGPGYEHSSALVKCLESYKHHQVQFIHRTARDYVLHTTEGQERLIACPISEDQLAQICFECRLISFGVLPAIQGVSQSPYTFARRMLNCPNCEGSAQWPSWTQVIQRLYDVVEGRGRVYRRVRRQGTHLDLGSLNVTNTTTAL